MAVCTEGERQKCCISLHRSGLSGDRMPVPKQGDILPFSLILNKNTGLLKTGEKSALNYAQKCFNGVGKRGQKSSICAVDVIDGLWYNVDYKYDFI